MHEDAEPFETSGLVKWFDPAKGFGFIIDATGGADILLHANVLLNFGQSSVAAGTRVRVRAVPTGRGAQAVEVLEVQAAATGPAAQIADLADCDPDDLARLPFLPARVKWFDKGKGFGFLNLFGRPGDVFAHVEVLRHAGLVDLAVGEAVAVRVIEGRRGPVAAQLAGWDHHGAADPSPAAATRAPTEPTGSTGSLALVAAGSSHDPPPPPRTARAACRRG